MAKKVNQFAQVVDDIRREIRKGQSQAAKTKLPTMTGSLSKLDPKNDPLKRAIAASGIKLRPERDKVR